MCVNFINKKIQDDITLEFSSFKTFKFFTTPNNNTLVFDTVDEAIRLNPKAHPLFHSDQGFQYTNRAFHSKPIAAGITQSMSRVGKCINNGPMEGFWGILKRERYYGKQFKDKKTTCKNDGG